MMLIIMLLRLTGSSLHGDSGIGLLFTAPFQLGGKIIISNWGVDLKTDVNSKAFSLSASGLLIPL